MRISKRRSGKKIINHIRTLPDRKDLKTDLNCALDLGADSFIELRYIVSAKETAHGAVD